MPVSDTAKSGRAHAALGILLVNLGTPDAPTAPAVRRYLAEFLRDRRVVEIPPLLWWPILYGLVLMTRPRRSAAAYAKVWTEAGSPLLVHARRQADRLRDALQPRLGDTVHVALGMRYGNPSIAAALAELEQRGMQRLLVLPMYPQYCAATTASTFDAVARVLMRWRAQPELRFVRDYHAHPGYIAALAASVREYWAQHGRGEKLLLSFHGIPKRNVKAGDPYADQCVQTAKLLAESLQVDADAWGMSFQSRFGPAEWLTPYTSDTLEAWGRDGPRRVDVLCPGFSADCLETLEEIAMENRDAFLEAGGEALSYIPALNDHPDHIAFLAELVTQQIRGWPEARETPAAVTGAAGSTGLAHAGGPFA